MAQSTETMLAMAFSEQIYRRADDDQQIGKTTLSGSDYIINSEGFGGLVSGDIIARGGAIAGMARDGGFYYNTTTGFVGQIIQAGGKTYVVFRGSDLSGSWLDTAVPFFTGDLTGDPAVTGKKADPRDWANNRELNEGSIDRTQLTDALALLNAARFNPAAIH